MSSLLLCGLPRPPWCRVCASRFVKVAARSAQVLSRRSQSNIGPQAVLIGVILAACSLKDFDGRFGLHAEIGAGHFGSFASSDGIRLEQSWKRRIFAFA